MLRLSGSCSLSRCLTSWCLRSPRLSNISRRVSTSMLRCRPRLFDRRWQPHWQGRAAGRSVGECGFEVGEDAELSEDHGSLRVAVEALDLAVPEFEDVAARSIHLLASRGQLSERQL